MGSGAYKNPRDGRLHPHPSHQVPKKVRPRADRLGSLCGPSDSLFQYHESPQSCVVGPTTLFGHGCDLSHFVPGPFFLRSSSDLQFFEAHWQNPELAALTRHAWKTARHSVIVCLWQLLAIIAVPHYSQSMPHSCHFPELCFVAYLDSLITRLVHCECRPN